MDQTFVKQQDIEQLSPIMAPERQEEAVRGNEQLQDAGQREYLTTMRQDLQEKQALDNSEWNGVFQRKNSSYMDEVKQANNRLHEHLLRPIPMDQAEFESSTAELESKYEELIGKCNTYLSNRKWAITPTGRARIRMVKQLLQNAILEKNRFKESAYDIFRSPDFEEGVLWGNTIHETRRTTIRTDARQEERTGGATSDVRVIRNADTTYYFKKEEKLLTADERIEKEILNNPVYKNQKAKINALRPYLTGEMANPVANVLKSIGIHPGMYKPVDAVKTVNITIKGMDPAAKQLDESFGDFLLEICPKFAQIFTLTNVSDSAKILPGSRVGVRNVATSRLAEALGISDLIAESKTVNLVTTDENGKEVLEKGNAMKKALGEDRNKIRERHGMTDKQNFEITPEAAGMLNALRIFDVLCGQVDRNTSNVLYQTEERNGKVVITGIMGIDNDISFGELTYEEISEYKTGVLQLKPLECEGKALIKSIDKNLAASILALTDDFIRNLMSDILSEKETAALINRLHGVQDLLNSGKIALVENWTEEKAKTVLETVDGAPKPMYLNNIKVNSGESA